MLDVAMIEFNDDVLLLQDFLPIDQCNPPILQARGAAEMGIAVKAAIGTVRERNKLYQSLGAHHHVPWILMITKGNPADNIDEAVAFVRAEQDAGPIGSLRFWSLAVEGANISTLRRFSDNVTRLRGLDFTSMFDWLSKSMSVMEPPPAESDWMRLPDQVPLGGW